MTDRTPGAVEWIAARHAIAMSTHPAVRGKTESQHLWLMRAQVHAMLALAAPGLDIDGYADELAHGADVDEHQDQDQAPAPAEPLVICGHYGPGFPAPGSLCILPVGVHHDGQHRGHRVPGLEDITPRKWPQTFAPVVVDELGADGSDVLAMVAR